MKSKQKKKQFLECHLIDCKLECKNCEVWKKHKMKHPS